MLRSTCWISFDKLQSDMEEQGLGNNTDIHEFQPERAWKFLKRFTNDHWEDLVGENIKIPHVGLEKAANFFADAGFLNFSKPDVQMRKTYRHFFANEHATARQAFFLHNQVAKELASESEDIYKPNEFKPRHLDRMIWLAGSGRLIDDRRTAPYTNDIRRYEVAKILLNG